MNTFTHYLQSRGFCHQTQKDTLRLVNHFFNHSRKEAFNVSKKDVLNYLEYQRKQGKQSATINIYLRQLRYYFDFLYQQEQISTNPCKLIKIRGVKRRMLHKTFTAEELTQLADDYHTIFIRNYDDKHIPQNLKQYIKLSRQRNYCMLTFLAYQGLHSNEVSKITLADIDLIKATVNIAGSPRTNPRKLNLKAEQIGALMHYTQNVRTELLKHYSHETDLLFLHAAKTNCSIKPNKPYGNIFNRLKEQLKTINPNFTTLAQLRASVITHHIQTDGLRKAQYIAGHRYVSSTEKYLPNDISRLSNDIEKYNPF